VGIGEGQADYLRGYCAFKRGREETMHIALFVIIMWLLAYGTFVAASYLLHLWAVQKKIVLPYEQLSRKKALQVACILSGAIAILVWVVGMASI
jgi:hypothetical protein